MEKKLNLGSRKVQIIRGTFFVSLPRTWTSNFNIRKGSEVKISLQDNGSLEISTIKDDQEGD
jgi:phosphate uptake regulator